MAARRRTTLAAELFALHPIRRGLEAGAFAYLKAALQLAVDPQSQALRRTDIKQYFQYGKELLSWLSRPGTAQESDEIAASVLRRIVQTDLPAQLMLQAASLVGRRRRGRPTESKFLAVLALEAKLARPEVKWKQIVGFVCQCGRLQHDEYCVENLEVQVRRLRSLLRRTGLARLIVANAKLPLLKRNLQNLVGRRES
jgi:hypothetical protein